MLNTQYKNYFFRAMFLITLGIFFLSYIFVIRYNLEHISELVKNKLNIQDISNITAIYYIFYSFLQIPFGLAFDKYSIKSVLTFSMMLCSFGLLIFGFTSNEYIAILGRSLIAIGSAAAVPFLAKIISIVMDNAAQRAKILAISISLAVFLGAMFQPKYTDLIFNNMTYEQGFTLLSFISLITIILFIVFGKIIHKPIKSQDEFNFVIIMKLILRPKIIFFCSCAGLMIGSFEGFPDLYGRTLLTIGHNFSIEDADYIKSFFFAGLAIGALLIPSNIKLRHLIIYYGIGFLLFWYLLLYTNITFSIALISYIGLGICSAYQMVVFSLIQLNINNDRYGASTVAFANSFIMAFGSLFQKLLPFSISIFNSYTPQLSILYGLSIIPILTLIAVIGFISVKGYNE